MPNQKKAKAKAVQETKDGGLRLVFLILCQCRAATGFAVAPMPANLCQNKNRKTTSKMCRNLEFVPVADLVPSRMPLFTKKRMRPEIVPKIT
ncbi:hypothetical protein, partial [Acidithiobacillus thiooxidans]